MVLTQELGLVHHRKVDEFLVVWVFAGHAGFAGDVHQLHPGIKAT
jgi:hypothetical protein